ncbi:hypothetical protein CLAFUW4_04439 [Fulvia fulva]|uniref:Uncharacterized protein n=1 Tax=Passalora fulva TaxID=5499 RepID=A0A9Q8P7U3_PASFU|nr:uncharacterized protein CLAFUR5_04403 [Fulvia fulva]KAK4627236.1 hypothetical protein CLAFUR4_04425 [Fulvia fulva]KAK4627708.1 hypothetical protein CLAFUR0_04428 [Fulvia fulva]UJO16393.1 hypothetical protein CLAFUR5_04403 [Fulvia fulva]WPV14143.1 hypothetical protein CLAFUW4_04439 [Fulvia fulva]WPV29152.1 hypothetical protein CLAFUW7_04430 [Fulvia fulva]
MPFRYNKVLVIGATSGIGLALAKKFVAEGSSVVATGRRKENLDDLAKQHEGNVDTVVFDITDLKGIPKFVEVFSKHPDVDCVLLNDGIQRHLQWQNPEGVDLDLLETEFTTNYLSYMHLTKALLPQLQKQAPKETALVYVTSGLALVPIMSCPNYCASKAALHHMVLAMRVQLKEINSNVKVIELLPPAVQTEVHDDKHQPEFKGRGRQLGMPLDQFTEEAYAGLNSDDNEQVPVQAVKKFFGFYDWEMERQKKMMGVYEMQKKQAQ